jgi:hypothetical protein
MRRGCACYWHHRASGRGSGQLTAGAEGYDGLVAALGQLRRDDRHEGLESLGVRLNVAPLKGGVAGGRIQC